jgi:hypothetical protein
MVIKFIYHLDIKDLFDAYRDMVIILWLVNIAGIAICLYPEDERMLMRKVYIWLISVILLAIALLASCAGVSNGQSADVTEIVGNSLRTSTPTPHFGLATSEKGGLEGVNSGVDTLPPFSTESYSLAFSTYLGGSNYQHARDVFVDNQGYIYITGGTSSVDFPKTEGPAFNNATCPSLGSAGQLDVFVAKFNPNGSRVWSRLLGGPCYDRAYAIEVDYQGYVYIAGRAGEGFLTTPGVFQPNFQGTDEGIYGKQDAFVAKLAPDGGSVIWASYVGVGNLARDLAIDSNGDVYVPLAYSGQGGIPPSSWFAHAFQPSLQGGTECGAIKISNDGSKVIWATWLGGSADDTQAASIRVDNNNNVYLALNTYSSNIPTTPGVFDRSYNGGADYYVAKLSSDGSSLIFGTYLGGSQDEFISTHNLALDAQGNVYVSVATSSSNFPTTNGAFQTKFGGATFDMAVSKLSPTGALLYSTFIGGNGNENPDGIYVDVSGNVFLTGQTSSTNFPVSVGAYQSINRGGQDAVLLRLSADFSHLLYSTYLGGSNDDSGRSGYLDNVGNLYMTGETKSSNWPTLNAFQNTYTGTGDVILAKFVITTGLTPTNTPTPTVTPGQSSSFHFYLPVTVR